jgi:hypothetical protein
MLRGPLDDAAKAEISAQLPDMDDLVEAAPAYGLLDWNSMFFRDSPMVPIAGVCLRDAISILSASRFATYEALAHQRWGQDHAEKLQHPDLYKAYYGRFFADDAALRLYAVGEHVAAAIVYLLQIDKAALQAFKATITIPFSSYQTLVGMYLASHFPKHPITQAVDNLRKSAEWNWVRRYRDRWVHEQPPLMEGFGIQFKRTIRWEDVPDASTPQQQLFFGTGDKPDYTVDELIGNVRGALGAITEITRVVAEHFAQTINSKQPNDSGHWSAPEIKS